MREDAVKMSAEQQLKDTAPFLRIDRAEFVEKIQLLAKIGEPRKTEQVILSFDGTSLYFDLCGISVPARAEGQWPCQARIHAGVLLALAKVPPADDPLILRAESGNLHIGRTFSCDCELQEQWQASIQLPMNYDDSMLLALKLKYTPTEIEQSGLKDSVARAEAACIQIVDRAVAELAPYKIKRKDVRALIDKSLRDNGIVNQV